MIQIRMNRNAPWWIVLGALILGVPLLVALLAFLESERFQGVQGIDSDSSIEQGAEAGSLGTTPRR
jgi:RsiW-degrading membrane proteinase PrsW (M82 family)